MQIIESTAIGVRGATIRLDVGDGTPRFHFFPMLHTADPAFYEEFVDCLHGCGLVLNQSLHRGNEVAPSEAHRTARHTFRSGNFRTKHKICPILTAH